MSSQDRKWLRKQYPKIIPTAEGVAGVAEFTAAYNEQTGLFFIGKNDVSDSNSGKVLKGKFNIRIRERKNKSLLRLPAVEVDGINPVPDRHFNQSDQSACFCNPLEEEEFLNPEFQFQKFFEELVIPFLYGQVFYSQEGHWPWSEYAHGAPGLLEGYFRSADSGKAEVCIQKLSLDKNWSRIKSLLLQKPEIKGHTSCFCLKSDKMRRCHPVALKGLLRLRQDIKKSNITVL